MLIYLALFSVGIATGSLGHFAIAAIFARAAAKAKSEALALIASAKIEAGKL
jgi:hypothetical protein